MDDAGVLRARHELEHLLLHVLRQRGADAVAVDRRAGLVLRLQEDLVAVLVGEANDLGLDARAVARADGFDLAGVQRRPVQIVADELVDLLVRVRDPARGLRAVDPVRQEGERRRLRVAELDFQLVEIDRGRVQPDRGAGLEPPQLQAESFETQRQLVRRRLAQPPARELLGADVHQAAQERPGRDDHRRGREHHAVVAADAADLPSCVRISEAIASTIVRFGVSSSRARMKS